MAQTFISIENTLQGLESDIGEPLPEPVKTRMEHFFGVDFSEVRVHQGPQAEKMGANAFTLGFDIYFAPGQFHPDSASGQQLLGHELAHVLQQCAGRVKTTCPTGISLVQDELLEAEADWMGLQASLQIQGRAGFGDAGLASRPAHGKTEIKASRQNLKKITSKTAGRTIQCQTNLTFDNDVRPGTDIVTGMHHARNAHAVVQKDLAAYLSGYNSHGDAVARGCAVCNHSISYSNVAKAVEGALAQQGNLQAVVNFLNGLNPNLPKSFTYRDSYFGLHDPNGWSFSVGAIPMIDIKMKIKNGVPFYSKANLDKEVDDLIANLANDPRNLFYWPDHTGDFGGTQVDNPKATLIATGYASLLNVTTRLAAYRQHLRNMGLGV